MLDTRLIYSGSPATNPVPQLVSRGCLSTPAVDNRSPRERGWVRLTRDELVDTIRPRLQQRHPDWGALRIEDRIEELIRNGIRSGNLQEVPREIPR